jgi:quercetin dioxygenase-like cupin family protein
VATSTISPNPWPIILAAAVSAIVDASLRLTGGARTNAHAMTGSLPPNGNFSRFRTPALGAAGFDVVAGRQHGLRRLMVVAGRLPKGDIGPMHVHEGDEVLRVVSGEILVRCGDERRACHAGDLVVVPPVVPHGFRVITETVLEVVAEYDIGTLFPVRTDHGATELIEVHRQDLPWGRAPSPGKDWTSDDELQQVLDRLAFQV